MVISKKILAIILAISSINIIFSSEKEAEQKQSEQRRLCCDDKNFETEFDFAVIWFAKKNGVESLCAVTHPFYNKKYCWKLPNFELTKETFTSRKGFPFPPVQKLKAISEDKRYNAQVDPENTCCINVTVNE